MQSTVTPMSSDPTSPSTETDSQNFLGALYFGPYFDNNPGWKPAEPSETDVSSRGNRMRVWNAAWLKKPINQPPSPREVVFGINTLVCDVVINSDDTGTIMCGKAYCSNGGLRGHFRLAHPGVISPESVTIFKTPQMRNTARVAIRNLVFSRRWQEVSYVSEPGRPDKSLCTHYAEIFEARARKDNVFREKHGHSWHRNLAPVSRFPRQSKISYEWFAPEEGADPDDLDDGEISVHDFVSSVSTIPVPAPSPTANMALSTNQITSTTAATAMTKAPNIGSNPGLPAGLAEETTVPGQSENSLPTERGSRHPSLSAQRPSLEELLAEGSNLTFGVNDPSNSSLKPTLQQSAKFSGVRVGINQMTDSLIYENINDNGDEPVDEFIDKCLKEGVLEDLPGAALNTPGFFKQETVGKRYKFDQFEELKADTSFKIEVDENFLREVGQEPSTMPKQESADQVDQKQQRIKQAKIRNSTEVRSSAPHKRQKFYPSGDDLVIDLTKDDSSLGTVVIVIDLTANSVNEGVQRPIANLTTRPSRRMKVDRESVNMTDG